MNLGFRNDLTTEQTQQLAMTPEMIQSLKILKLSGGELLDYIFDAMDENPVLDVVEEDLANRQMVAADDVPIGGWEKEDAYPGQEEYDAYSEREAYPEADFFPEEEDSWYGNYDDVNGGIFVQGGLSYDSEMQNRYDYDSMTETSLVEHLSDQLEMVDAPFLVRAVADYIIQILDENGYLIDSVQDIAAELHVEEDTVMEALRMIWTFDPAGVGARDIQECMRIQLQSIGKYDSVYGTIVENHLEDIAAGRYSAIMKSTGLKRNQVQDRADIIRSLEPKPGRKFSSSDSVRYIIPDVKVKKMTGEYKVFINRAASPRVIIRDEYNDLLQDTVNEQDVRDFLSVPVHNAKWLIRAINQRNETLLRVSTEIVRRQESFFEEGRSGLKALTMKEVAQSLDLHESTVSRAVNGKYLICTQGVFELRYFFTGSSKYEDTDMTAESLKQFIQKLIESEDRTSPMSDRSIAEAILLTGVRISRRTVAKYREEMGVPSSSGRKQAR